MLWGDLPPGDGSYTYTVDNANAAVQALRINGQTLDDVFTYTVTDAVGLTSTSQITLRSMDAMIIQLELMIATLRLKRVERRTERLERIRLAMC